MAKHLGKGDLDKLPDFSNTLGALVLVKQPKELNNKKDQFNPRMIPHILVGIGIGPGCIWDKTYLVVKLEKMLGDNRGSRVNIRKSPNVMFPDTPSFPRKAKLTASRHKPPWPCRFRPESSMGPE